MESSHASTALSYADGLAKAFELTGQRRRHVVAVVGDGAMTGGMCWEALNNIAAAEHRRIIIVVNDNGRSYAPTIGGLASHLAGLRLTPSYEKVLDESKKLLRGMPVGSAGLRPDAQPQGRGEGCGVAAGDVHRPGAEICRSG